MNSIRSVVKLITSLFLKDLMMTSCIATRLVVPKLGGTALIRGNIMRGAFEGKEAEEIIRTN